MQAQAKIIKRTPIKGGWSAKVLPPIGSFVFTAFLFLQMHNTLGPASFIKRLFLPSDDWQQSIIPLIILYIFLWTVIDLLIKINLAYREKHCLSRPLLWNVAETLAAIGIQAAVDEVNSIRKKLLKRIAYQRLDLLIHHLQSKQDPVRSHEYIRHQLEIDGDAISSEYVIARIFIWAMPILGFIGTVIGISLAIGNFSHFLSGEIEDISLVKTQLSAVASGLSFAFDTTLLGLATSLVAMLLATYAQKLDEVFINKLDELCLGIISSFNNCDSAHAEPMLAQDASLAWAQLRIEIQTTKDEMTKIATLTQQIADGAECVCRQFSAGVIDIGHQTNRIVESVQSFQNIADNASEALAVNYRNLEKRSSEIVVAINQLPEKLQIDRQSLINAFGSNMDTIQKLLNDNGASQNAELRGIVQVIQAVVATLQNAIANNQEMNQTLHNLDPVLRDLAQMQNRLIPLLNQISMPHELKLVPINNQVDQPA